MKKISVQDQKFNQFQKKLERYNTIWNQFTDAIKEVDIFGSYVYLKFNNDYKYRSVVGGLISITFIAFSLVFFLRNFTNFLSDENMIVKTEQFHREIPPQQDLNQDTFMFAARIQQYDNNFITNPDFDIKIYHYYAQKNSTGHIISESRKQIELEQCTKYHWNTTQDLLFNARNQNYYSDWLCPKQNDYQFSIQGDQSQELFEEIIIDIDYCEPNSENCNSKDNTIQKYQNKNIPFEMIFTNIQINSESINEEVKQYITSPFLMQLSPQKLFKQRNIYLTQTKLNIDSSKVYTEMQDEKTFPLFSQGNIVDEYELYDSVQHQNTVGRMNLRSDYYQVNHSKKYQKLDIFLAQLGGFINIGFIVSALIANFYNQYELDIKLANQLYRFEFKKNKFEQLYQKAKVITPEDVQKATKKAAEKMMQLKRKRKTGILSEQTKDKIKDHQIKQQLGFQSKKEYLLDIFKQYVSRKKLQLSSQFLIYKLSFGILFDTEENKLIEQARSQMLKDMDIHTLLQKVQEIDKLKNLLLDRNQSILYNFSPKPVLTIEKENEKDQSQNLLKETPKFDKLGEYKHLFFAYSAINKSNPDNGISNRLVKLLGDDLKQVFDSSELVFTTKDKNFQLLKEKVKETLLKKYRQKKIKQLKYLNAQLKWKRLFNNVQWKGLIKNAIAGIKQNEPERWKKYLIRKRNMILEMEKEEKEEQERYAREQKERILKKPNKNNSLQKIKEQLEKEIQELNLDLQNTDDKTLSEIQSIKQQIKEKQELNKHYTLTYTKQYTQPDNFKSNQKQNSFNNNNNQDIIQNYQENDNLIQNQQNISDQKRTPRNSRKSIIGQSDYLQPKLTQIYEIQQQEENLNENQQIELLDFDENVVTESNIQDNQNNLSKNLSNKEFESSHKIFNNNNNN